MASPDLERLDPGPPHDRWMMPRIAVWPFPPSPLHPASLYTHDTTVPPGDMEAWLWLNEELIRQALQERDKEETPMEERRRAA